MTALSCKFDCHPVGQGLFYSGQVNEINFVYDCGTDSGTDYKKAALAAYQNAGGILDLLIISHFHADHMNAVSDLLSSIKKVKEVVLPYLCPAERLLVGAGYAIANDLDDLDDDYISFLVDPVSYLTQYGADGASFSFLRPGEAVTDWPNTGQQVAGDYGWYPDDEQPLPDNSDQMLGQGNVKIRDHASIYRVPLWNFKFYCQPGRATAKDIENRLGELVPPIELTDLCSVLSDRLKDLKVVYHKLFKGSLGQNSTSVVCCHGPAVPRDSKGRLLHAEARVVLATLPRISATGIRVIGDGYLAELFSLWHWLSDQGQGSKSLLPPTQLLTGDANLKLIDYENHFSQELDGIGFALVPHHGSPNNWRNNLPAKLPNCLAWAVSAGLGNKHKHPDKGVVDSIIQAGRQLLVANETQGVTIYVDGWSS